MLPNIDQTLYARFKRQGYRIKQYQEQPVPSISEIVRLAYLDVCRTMGGIDAGQGDSFKRAVEEFIEQLLSRPPADQAEFDLLHHDCCQRCMELSQPGGTRIHYGQAQKLLNMSLKYLYNEYATYKGVRNIFGFPDNNIEQFFHLPVDSQIRDHLVNKCRFTTSKSPPWSKWTYAHYMTFQNQLRKRLSAQHKPLEIDYILWNTDGASIGDAIA